MPYSVKKPGDFGGAIWLIICGPLELVSVDSAFSTYSKREANEDPILIAVLLVVGAGTCTSSGV